MLLNMLVVHLFVLVAIVACGCCLQLDKTRKVRRDLTSSEILEEEDDYVIDESNLEENIRASPRKISLLKCKRYHQISKVVRGRDAKSKEFPHMAVLGYGDDKTKIKWNCGGSLISEKFVLTSAHCLISPDGEPVKYVRLGDLDIKSDTDDAKPQQFTIKKKIKHPSFQSPSRYHDIALLQLNRKVNFTAYVLPACVALTRDLSNTVPSVAGWGLKKKGGNPANILQTALMEYVAVENCSITYSRSAAIENGVVDDLMICAGGGTNKTDTCQGDSGGPLQIINNFYEFGTFYEVVGITSFGKSCGLLPGVYTRAYPYFEWIENTVWPLASVKSRKGRSGDQ